MQRSPRLRRISKPGGPTANGTGSARSPSKAAQREEQMSTAEPSPEIGAVPQRAAQAASWLRWAGVGGLLQLIGINIWDAESDGRRFIEEQRITYPNALDPGGQFAIELGVTGLPETYFINPEGQIFQHWIGPASAEKLLALIAQVATAGNPT